MTSRTSYGILTLLVLHLAVGVGVVHAVFGPQSPRIDFRLSEPMTRADFERWMRQLQLSDAQTEAATMLFEDYQIGVSTWYQGILSKVQQASREAATFPLTSHGRAHAYEDMAETIADAEAKLQQKDNSLFEKLSPLLAEPQLEELPYVMLDRNRVRLRSLLELAEVPIAQLDLVEMVEALGMSEDERAAVDPILKSYLARMVPLIRHADAQYRKTLVKDEHLLTAASEDRRNDAQFQDMIDTRKRIWSRQLNIWRQMAAVNDEFFQTLLATVGVEHRDSLIASRNQTAYPMVYDGPNATMAFQHVLELPLDQEEKEAVQVLLYEYQEAYEKICRSIENEVDRWKAKRALNGLYSVFEFEEHKQVVHDLKEERDALVHRAYAKIYEVVPEERISSLQRMTEDN